LTRPVPAGQAAVMGPQASVHLFFGNDAYTVSTRARELIDALVPEDRRAFGLEQIDGAVQLADEAAACVARCRESLLTVGLFGAAKVTWLKDASFLGEDTLGGARVVKECVATLTDLIKAGLPDGVTLVVSASKLTKRSAFYKACAKAGAVYECAVSEKAWEAQKDAMERLRAALKERGLTMTRAAAEAFLGRVGVETGHIVGEVTKLDVYLGAERRRVEADDVAAVACASREAVGWDLYDAFGDRNLAAAVTAARGLLFQGQSAIGLLLGLGRRARDLLLLREAMEQGWLGLRKAGPGVKLDWSATPPEAEAALEALGKDPRSLHPFYAGKLAAQAKRFSCVELRAALARILDTHTTLVTSSMPEDTALELLLIRTHRPTHAHTLDAAEGRIGG
jgi:DNA polymerase III subunit delta